MDSLASLIKEKRKAKNWSQLDLALRLGVCHQFIYNVEKGIVSLPPARALNLAQALDIHIETVKEYLMEEYSKKLDKLIYE